MMRKSHVREIWTGHIYHCLDKKYFQFECDYLDSEGLLLVISIAKETSTLQIMLLGISIISCPIHNFSVKIPYHKIPNISIGPIAIPKHILGGLYSRAYIRKFIFGGGLYSEVIFH